MKLGRRTDPEAYSAGAISQKNVEVVRRVYAAVARGDTAAVLALYDPDVEWDVSHLPLMSASPYRGHEGLRRWFREWYEAWESLEEDCEELIEAGDQVVSITTAHGRGRASGLQVDWERRAGVWAIRDGRVIRGVWFTTRKEALVAVGLRE